MATVSTCLTTAHTHAYGVVRIPYWRIDSGVEGPRLLITCAQHGNEVQGAEAVRRFLPLAAEGLKCGRVDIVPFANRPALWNRRPHISSTPERPYGDDAGHNMNRTWPGNPEGNDTERLSAAIYQAVGEEATHCLDIHCWARFTGPASLPRKDRPQSMELARICAIPFATPRSTGTSAPASTPRTIGALFNDTDRVALTIELSGQYVIYEREVRWGLRAILNLVRFLGMMEGDIEPHEHPIVWTDQAERATVKAPVNGLFGPVEGLATAVPVREGQLLGTLLSDEDLSITEVRAPIDGFLYAYGCFRPDCDVSLAAQHPYASRGDQLAVILRPK